MKTYRTITAVELEYPRVRDKALWILNSGVVIDLGTGFHLDYIRSHLSEFGIGEVDLDIEKESERYFYGLAFKSGAIRVHILANKFNNGFSIHCSKKALGEKIGIVHDIFKKYTNNKAQIYLELDGGDGVVEVMDIMDDMSELYKYTGNKKEYRYGGSGININMGWISPSGEICEISDFIPHWRYILDHLEKFGIDADLVEREWLSKGVESIYWLAFEKGAIRYYSSYGGAFNIQCTRNGLGNRISEVHKLYKKLGCHDGIQLSFISGKDDMIGTDIRIDDIGELYSYASNVKIYKVASGINVGWISPSGETCEISDLRDHWKYVKDNLGKFNIKMEEIEKNELGLLNKDSIYWLAFRNGAIRYQSSMDGILNIQCTRNGLSNRISEIHKLYNKLGCNNGLWMSIVNGKEDTGSWREDDIRMDDISELYSYAGSTKVYKIGKRGSFLRDSESAFNWAIDNIDLELGGEGDEGDYKKAYREMYRERASAYSDKYNNLVRNGGEIEIYRALLISSNQEVDYSNIGTHWSFEKSGVGTYGAKRSKVEGDNTVILTGVTDINNIDWEYGFTSFMYYGEDQWECSLLSGSRVSIIAVNDKSIKPILALAGENTKIYRISMKISIEEKRDIIDLVNRVRKGYTNWVPEDLQLYQNNSKVIESLLRGEEVNWDSLVEDEFDKELRELKGMI